MSNAGPFSAVIFDFGGVISSSPLLGMRSYCEREGVPMDALRALFATHDGAWSKFEMNSITQDEFVAAFEEEARAQGYTLNGRDFLTAFFAGMAMRPEMIAVVRHLRGRYKLGCITNNVRVVEQRNVLLDELFDVLVESSKVGVRKPDPRIYQIACDLLGVTPEQSIFLDDFGVNLKAARELGMATIKVDETTSAIDELEALLGIPLPRTPDEAVAT